MIEKVHAANYGVYGARKVHAEVRRQGHLVARCTVERLMRSAGLRGITRAKGPRTTVPGTGPDTRPDLVDRAFTATGPDQLWVADITYCRTFAGWVYAAFVTDVYSRRVVGWQRSKSLRTDLAIDALEMSIGTRRRAGRDLGGLIHHSDKGVQYVAVRYTQRLAEAGAVASVGTTGDSYDNALAEAFNSLFKAELVRNKGPWKGIDDLEIAVADGGTSHEVGEHRLVQPPTPARRDRPRPTGRARRHLLPAQHRGDYRRRVSSEPPLNPGRDSVALGRCRVAGRRNARFDRPAGRLPKAPRLRRGAVAGRERPCPSPRATQDAGFPARGTGR